MLMPEDLQARRGQIADNIATQFITTQPDIDAGKEATIEKGDEVEILTEAAFNDRYGFGHQVYTEEAVAEFEKAVESAALELPYDQAEELIKGGKKDLSKLTRKVIIDKNGHRKTVLVDLHPGTTHDPDPVKEDAHVADLSKKIQDTVDGNSSKSDKVRELLAHGVIDKHDLADLSGAHYSQVHSIHKAHVEAMAGGTAAVAPATSGAAAADDDDDTTSVKLPVNIATLKLPKLDVDGRWKSYEMFAEMVVQGMRKSAIAYGRGGVGKTYTLNKVLDSNNMKPFDEDTDAPGSANYDYVKITGKSTPTDMYKQLYLHNNKIIIFDDCDSVLKDATSINILKGALDTTGDGTISYGSGKPIKDGDDIIPQRFKFTGQVVFISNLQSKDMPQPLKSRSLCVDLTMTAGETIDRMRQIVHKMPFQGPTGKIIQVDAADRDAAVNFLDKYKDAVDIDNLNARTLGSIALVKRQVDARNAADGTSVDWETIAGALLN